MDDRSVTAWIEKEGFAIVEEKRVVLKIQDMVEYIIALRERIAELEKPITVIGGKND